MANNPFSQNTTTDVFIPGPTYSSVTANMMEEHYGPGWDRRYKVIAARSRYVLETGSLHACKFPITPTTTPTQRHRPGVRARRPVGAVPPLLQPSRQRPARHPCADRTRDARTAHGAERSGAGGESAWWIVWSARMRKRKWPCPILKVPYFLSGNNKTHTHTHSPTRLVTSSESARRRAGATTRVTSRENWGISTQGSRWVVKMVMKGRR